MTVIMALFLGLVQGITEFLPVSSSGHLSILQNLLKVTKEGDSGLLFEVLLHLGTLVSVCVVYKSEIKTMITDGIDFLRARGDSDADEPVTLKPPARALLFVLVGTIPMLLAVIFSNSIERLFYSTGFIGFALLITGGLLYISDRYVKKGNKTEKTITLKDAIIIGLSQAVATLPGLSRSGTTVAVGLACGLNGSFAVRFSLLLSIPAVFGATVLTFFKAIKAGVDFSQFPVYLAGFAVAAAVGFFAIQFIRRLMAKGSFGNIAYYCWGIGALTLILTLVTK